MTYDSQIASTCAARAICTGHRHLCAPTCVAYTELETQIRLSAIPRRYHAIGDGPASANAAADLIRADNGRAAAFIAGWGADVWQHVEDGRGLYLCGRVTGSGKTTAATAIALDYIRTCVSMALAGRQAIRRQLVYFVHVPTFLRQAKMIYEDDTIVAQESSSAVAAMTKRMIDVPLLIADDIGAEKPTEAVRERLLTIIDARWSESRSTVYTSNLALNELEMALGARVRSRIEGATTALPFGGNDHRRKGVGA